MKITGATFGIEHKKKMYNVHMTVQDTNQNQRRAVVMVSDINGKALLHESMSGRQLICPETAKNAIRAAIKKNTQ